MEGTPPAAAPADASQQPQVHPGDPSHHIHRQPRDFSGRVNGAPRPGGQARADVPTDSQRQANETEAQAARRMRVKYAVGKEEREEELSQEELSAALAERHQLREMKRGMHSKFEEAAKVRKEAEQLRKEFEEGLADPVQFRKRLEANFVKQGLKPDAARAKARDILAHSLGGLLQEDDLSPEQRELQALREEREARQREEEEALAEQELEEHRGVVREKAKAFTARLGAALQKAKAGPIPVTESAMKAMGAHLLASMKHGVECTDEELVEVFHEEARGNVSAILGEMEFPDIERMYPDLVRKVHAGLLAKRQAAKPGARPPAPAQRQRPAEAEPVPVASDDFAAYQAAMNARRGR